MKVIQYLKKIWFDVFKRVALTQEDKNEIVHSEFILGLLCIGVALLIALIIRMIHYI